MKRLLIICALILACIEACAQQDLTMSQQFFSRINKNPAGIGNMEDVDIFALGRLQWANTDYSPKAGVLNVQSYIDKIHSGLGFTFGFDDIGVAKKSYNPCLVYDYVAKLTNNALLSMGVSAGIQYGYFNPEKYDLGNESERGSNTFPDTKQSKVTPDFNFGFEFTTPSFMIGASATHITENDATSLIKDRHFYLYGRYFYDINEVWELTPALVWMHKNKTNVTELNLTAYYNAMFWGGLTYHPDVNDKFSSNPVAFTIGAEYSNFRIGYSFDLSIGKVADYARTAHELMLSYSFRKKAKTIEN